MCTGDLVLEINSDSTTSIHPCLVFIHFVIVLSNVFTIESEIDHCPFSYPLQRWLDTNNTIREALVSTLSFCNMHFAVAEQAVGTSGVRAY